VPEPVLAKLRVFLDNVNVTLALPSLEIVAPPEL
jgi:hypothetical protein